MRRLLIALPFVLVLVAATFVAMQPEPADPAGAAGPETAADTAAATEPVSTVERHRVRAPAPESIETSEPADTDNAPSEREATIRGRVRFHDGTPVRYVHARLVPPDDSGLRDTYWALGRDGRFEAPVERSVAYDVVVHVRLEDGGDAVLFARDVRAGDAVDIVTPRRARVHGTLVSAGGTPLPGIAIEMSADWVHLGGSLWMRHGGVRVVTEGEAGTPSPLAGAFRAETFVGLDLLPSLPDHDMLTVAGAQPLEAGTPGTVVAYEGAVIEGVCVSEDGAALDGASVTARGPGRERLAMADEQGHFRIGALTPGQTYEVEARAYGLMWSNPRNVPSGTSGLRLELVRSRTLEGWVRDADGLLEGQATLIVTGSHRGEAVRYEIPVRSGRFLRRGVLGRDLEASIRVGEAQAVSLGRIPEPGLDGRVELVLPD